MALREQKLLARKRFARRQRTRRKVLASGGRPRLIVHRSNLHVYAQLVHPLDSTVLASASTVEKEIGAALKSTSNKEAAAAVGQAIGKRAVEKGITEVVFDRKAFRYHGRVKALADAAREAGLAF